MLPQKTLVYCMLAVEQNTVLLGTNTGHVIVCDVSGSREKGEGTGDRKEHRLAQLSDSVLCFSYVK